MAKNAAAIHIYTLGRFGLLVHGHPPEQGRKTQNRPLDLLKALIAFGARNVAVEHLAQALWPEAEGDQWKTLFDTTLHRLRRLLGVPEALELSGNLLTLKGRHCWVDCWHLQRLFSEMDALLHSDWSGTEAARITLLSSEAQTLYQGAFLDRDPTRHWALSLRERLRSRYLRMLDALARYFERHGQTERALDCYLRCLDVDALAEPAYQGLMRGYIALDRRAEALSVYQRCRRSFSVVLGIEPNTQTRNLYMSLCA